MDILLIFTISIIMINCVNSFIIREINFGLFFILNFSNLFSDCIISPIIIFQIFYLFLEIFHLFFVFFKQPSNWLNTFFLFSIDYHPFFKVGVGKFEWIWSGYQTASQKFMRIFSKHVLKVNIIAFGFWCFLFFHDILSFLLLIDSENIIIRVRLSLINHFIINISLISRKSANFFNCTILLF